MKYVARKVIEHEFSIVVLVASNEASVGDGGFAGERGGDGFGGGLGG